MDSLTYSMKLIYYLFIISVCVCVRLTRIFVPHWQYSEYEGTECGSEISSPVIPHSKICRRDLNTEQHTWEIERASVKIEKKEKLNNSRESNLEREHERAREVNSNNKNKQ